MQYYYLRTTHYDLRGQPQTKGSLVPLPRRLIRIRAIVCRGRCIRLGWLSKAGGRSIARLRLRTDKMKVAVANRIAGGRTAGNMTAAVERLSRSWSGAEEQGRTAVDFHTHPVASFALRCRRQGRWDRSSRKDSNLACAMARRSSGRADSSSYAYPPPPRLCSI